MKVEVVHVAPTKCFTAVVEVAEGATIQSAIDACGILRQFPEIDLAVLKVGVFSKLKPLSALLADGDRVEIYRPVTAVAAGAGKRAREAKAEE
jgi:putative ubiquitin-RnfH superfamily antitoxin RatB of RatAB toxin-antitoxin module